MLLSSFKYRTNGWSLEDMSSLEVTNLLVGRNASGKTRIINSLLNVTSFLCGKPKMFKDRDFYTQIILVGSNDVIIEYSFEVSNGRVVSEILKLNEKVIVNRNEEKAYLKDDLISPPADKLVVQVRRDRDVYPEIEEIMDWAEGVTFISCSNLNPYTIYGPNELINPIPFSEMVGTLSDEERNSVIKSAHQLGYDILSIRSIEFNSDLKYVSIEEKGVKDKIIDFQLSNGMMRVLYLLCYIEYMKQCKKCNMLLIDDLGEGLDYYRATLLGQKIFDACKTRGVQMIASSNDSFLMDVIDLSHWQILVSNKKSIITLNNKNSSDLFVNFRMTGLSNFDLFSSDFIDNYLKNKSK